MQNIELICNPPKSKPPSQMKRYLKKVASKSHKNFDIIDLINNTYNTTNVTLNVQLQKDNDNNAIQDWCVDNKSLHHDDHILKKKDFCKIETLAKETKNPNVDESVYSREDFPCNAYQNLDDKNKISYKKDVDLIELDAKLDVKSDIKHEADLKSCFNENLDSPNVYHCNKCLCQFQSKDSFIEHIQVIHGQNHLHTQIFGNINNNIMKARKSIPCINDFSEIVPNLKEKRFSIKATTGEDEKQNFVKDLRTENDIRKDVVKQKVYINVHKEITESLKQKCNKCNICGKIMGKRTLQAHFTEVHSNNAFKCTVCDKTFKCKRYLTKHIQTVHGFKEPNISFVDINRPLHKCSVCYKLFKTNVLLTNHITKVHSAPVECDICHREFTKFYLNTHKKRIHGDEREYICKVCHQQFKLKKEVKKHVKIAHGIKSSDKNKYWDSHIVIKSKDYLNVKQHLKQYKDISKVKIEIDSF